MGAVVGLAGNPVDRGAPPVRRPAGTARPTRSFYSATGLRRALRELPAGTVTMLALRADSFDATLAADGKTTAVHMTADGGVTTVNSPVGIPGKAVRVDPAAPARIVRTLARDHAGEVATMVLLDGRWRITAGHLYEAPPSGTRVTKLA